MVYTMAITDLALMETQVDSCLRAARVFMRLNHTFFQLNDAWLEGRLALREIHLVVLRSSKLHYNSRDIQLFNGTWRVTEANVARSLFLSIHQLVAGLWFKWTV